MGSTINITRALRVENESGVSGAEAITVDSVDILDQIVSAATEEQTAMGGFRDTQLQALSLSSDVDVDVQFLGTRFAILATVAGPPGTITHTGDLTAEIAAGDLVRVEGTVGDDGVYKVATSVLALGVTTITLEDAQRLPAGGGGAVGTVARVCSKQLMSYSYPLLTSAAVGTVTITGDLTDKFAAGDHLVIALTAGNDGLFEVATCTVLAGVTTITLVEALVGAEGAVGNIYKARDSFAVAAGSAWLWSVESGQSNPFIHPGGVLDIQPIYNVLRGRVEYCMVNCPGAVNANFKGRICKEPDIF